MALRLTTTTGLVTVRSGPASGQILGESNLLLFGTADSFAASSPPTHIVIAGIDQATGKFTLKGLVPYFCDDYSLVGVVTDTVPYDMIRLRILFVTTRFRSFCLRMLWDLEGIRPR